MTVNPICLDCRHYWTNDGRPGLRCAAFPNGIPEKVLSGIVDHSKKNFPGDRGIRFEPWPEDMEGAKHE